MLLTALLAFKVPTLLLLFPALLYEWAETCLIPKLAALVMFMPEMDIDVAAGPLAFEEVAGLLLLLFTLLLVALLPLVLLLPLLLLVAPGPR